jgi:hypothetical protein
MTAWRCNVGSDLSGSAGGCAGRIGRPRIASRWARPGRSAAPRPRCRPSCRKGTTRRLRSAADRGTRAGWSRCGGMRSPPGSGRRGCRAPPPGDPAAELQDRSGAVGGRGAREVGRRLCQAAVQGTRPQLRPIDQGCGQGLDDPHALVVGQGEQSASEPVDLGAQVRDRKCYGFRPHRHHPGPARPRSARQTDMTGSRR